MDPTGLKRVGFWSSHTEPDLPWPQDLVDPSWDLSERKAIAGYLRAGRVKNTWRCVFKCRICRKPIGNTDRTDGVYLWPEGLDHYVVEHSVRLPAEFLAHVRRRLAVTHATGAQLEGSIPVGCYSVSTPSLCTGFNPHAQGRPVISTIVCPGDPGYDQAKAAHLSGILGQGQMRVDTQRG